jgi:YesN/AraC family two-component response regulator
VENECVTRPVVLVIDDDDGVHAALRLVLEDDYDVISALSGDVGLREIDQRPVDLVLLDLLMPEVDGWEVFEQVRRMTGHRPKVIFLTGIDSSRAAVAALKLGAEDWVVKPFDESTLLAQLRSLLLPGRSVVIQGGDLGTRACVAVLFLSRCGGTVDYQPAGYGGRQVLDVRGAHTEAGLTAVLSRPPISLTGLSRFTRAVLQQVSGRFADVNVESLTTALDRSSGYLSERFRRETGLTLRDYIARVRVEVIKQRLGQPGCPPLEGLAEEVGLCHASHLSRLFTRYVHESPGLYRAKMQSDR